MFYINIISNKKEFKELIRELIFFVVSLTPISNKKLKEKVLKWPFFGHLGHFGKNFEIRLRYTVYVDTFTIADES